MPFSPKTKTEMFIRCGRICCLCLKQCGTNMEAAHIVDEAKDGPNDAENGIPVCFDCHQEIGAYNEKHPRGNKLRPKELVARRDRIYALVESGVIHAQIIAERARSSHHSSGPHPKLAHSRPPKPSAEAKLFLQMLLSAQGPPVAATRKLTLLNDTARAYVLDELKRLSPQSATAIEALSRIILDDQFPKDQAVLLAEQVMRAVTLFGDVPQKAGFLRSFPDVRLLRGVDRCVRLAFFEDLIEIVRHDQFAEVNELVPVLVDRSDAIPNELHAAYVLALLDQARSNSFRGAPAARRALRVLPPRVAKAGLDSLDSDTLFPYLSQQYAKDLVDAHKHVADEQQTEMLEDFVTLTSGEFIGKYFREGEGPDR